MILGRKRLLKQEHKNIRIKGTNCKWSINQFDNLMLKTAFQKIIHRFGEDICNILTQDSYTEYSKAIVLPIGKKKI